MRAKLRLKLQTYKFCLTFKSYLMLSFTLFQSVSAQTVKQTINPAIGNIQTQQNLRVQQNIPDRPQQLDRVVPKPPSQQRLPEPQAPEPLPPPEDLIPPSDSPVQQFPSPGKIDRTFKVKKIKVIGSTVFKEQDFEPITKGLVNRQIKIAELLQASSLITKLYKDKGYITSGAFIPPQTLKNGELIIQVLEGKLEDIKIRGNRRLKSSYVRSRLALAGKQPLNNQRLLRGLQLLQLNPLIETISAELGAGTRPGENLLEVTIKEAKTFSPSFSLDNNGSPGVGTFSRQIQVNEGNLLGYGDNITASYTNTDGSNSFSFNYALPINPRNGNLILSYGSSDNNIIEKPFNLLDIESASRYYELTLRQPLRETPNEEFALGFTFSRRESKISSDFLEGEGIPASDLSLGADEDGRTRVNAIRFFQDWSIRDRQQVFALRSQFSIGLGAFDSTINDNSPDGRFYTWRGQMQWARLLAPDTVLVLRGDVQLADRPLVSFEQFGLGGVDNVRGYGRDILLKDNGVFASAELRVPIARFSKENSLLQLTPFVDFGTVWNRSGRDENNFNSDPDTLASVGVGLRLQLQDNLVARFDWGIPLVSTSRERDTLQEDGFHLSIISSPF
ncbi:ShlB/FhaC/HecB family hemolysin secretion/activation protein [Mastigocoleus testarum]|uniref:Hemolysin activation/secretion protein n=1 Tax=Mastigocoleus testarum BC008 TaxID=371196 RepID=A0A0V7ZQ87_9CYAN|nr:hemolysin activation/secretion protein [Mastigocoleus testarum BC008]